MGDSFGKKNHERVKARKAVVREERRVARTKRRREREIGPADAPPEADALAP